MDSPLLSVVLMAGLERLRQTISQRLVQYALPHYALLAAQFSRRNDVYARPPAVATCHDCAPRSCSRSSDEAPRDADRRGAGPVPRRPVFSGQSGRVPHGWWTYRDAAQCGRRLGSDRSAEQQADVDAATAAVMAAQRSCVWRERV